MTKLTKCALALTMASAFCLADTWTGKLIDTSCREKAKASGQTMDCTATKATAAFGVQLPDGKVLSLNADGNAKAADAVRNSKSVDMQVSISGSVDENGGVRVESLVIQE